VLIAAGVMTYDERPATVKRAIASAAACDLVFTFGSHRRIGDELEEAAVRSVGLERAQRMGAEWYLQLDADERLARGELLRTLLELANATGTMPAYPLPYLLESGAVMVAPFKLFRTEHASFVLGSDVLDFGDGPRLCSGIPYPEYARPALLALPHLRHVPSERPDAGEHDRLSERVEGTSSRDGIPTLELPWTAPLARAAE
jgi:hypothetical protein